MMNAETENFRQVNVRLTLKFFDEALPEGRYHATSIVAVAGEDLGAGLLKHCLEHTRNCKVKILPGTPTTGNKKGPRLDRWIDVTYPDGTGYLYQTENKNSSAWAMGGKILKVDESLDKVKERRIICWQETWDNEKNTLKGDESILKVLTPMKRPPEAIPSHALEPLIIYWGVLHPEGQDDSFFQHDLGPDHKFSRVWFFSMSQYLRNLSESFIKIEMPIAAKRIYWLGELFPGL